MNIAIITAGGVGSRMGHDTPKQYLELAGVPILVRTLRVFAESENIAGIVVVVPASHLIKTVELVTRYKLQKIMQIVKGGLLRQDSVEKGLAMVTGPVDLVAVHDGARPFVSVALIDACLAKAQKHGAAMAAIPVSDTIKEVAVDGVIQRTIDRSSLWRAQTPQVVNVQTLRQAFAVAKDQGFEGTDEASLLELVGEEMVVVNGSEQNIKITTPADFVIAQALCANEDDGNG